MPAAYRDRLRSYSILIIFLIVGIVVLIGTIVEFALEEHSFTILDDVYLDHSLIAIVLIVAACLMIIMGFIYCFGVTKDDGVYTGCWVTLLIIFICLYAVVFVCIWYRIVGTNYFYNLMVPKGGYDEISAFAHDIQLENKCCGYYGYEDYTKVHHPLPLSCCKEVKLTTGGDMCDQKEAHQKGCRSFILDLINRFTLTLGILAIIAEFFVLFGLVAAFNYELYTSKLPQRIP